MLEVVTKWYLSVIGKDEEYTINFNCPHCKRVLTQLEFLDFKPNKKIDKVVKCFYCNEKFKLKIDEVSE